MNRIIDDSHNIWVALRHTTEGEPKRVVQGVRTQDGYAAWWSLCRHYEPQVEASRGEVYERLGKLSAETAKTVQDTRNLVMKYEEANREVEEMTGRGIDEVQAKTILLSFFRPRNKTSHTVLYQRTFQNNQTENLGICEQPCHGFRKTKTSKLHRSGRERLGRRGIQMVRQWVVGQRVVRRRRTCMGLGRRRQRHTWTSTRHCKRRMFPMRGIRTFRPGVPKGQG